MNILKFLAPCLFATALAFAQQFPWEANPTAATGSSPDSTVSQEAVPSSSSPDVAVYPPPLPDPSSSSVEEAKPAEGKTIFDSVRGLAYNPYSTVGAASTVRDLVLIPSDINGQKFVYISPIDLSGYTAFPLGSGSAMLGLDNSPLGSPAALVLGYANSLFGFALDYSVAKTWESSSVGNTDASNRTTYPGDNIGLYFSVPLGSATLYANATWLTYSTSNSFDNNGTKGSSDFSEMQANVGLIGTSGSLNYDGYLNVIRTGGTQTNNNGDKAIDRYSYLGSALNFNIGYAALQSSTARVIIGSNNRLVIVFYDEIKGGAKSDNIMGFVISPNILTEVSLFDNWLAFAGATHALNLTAGDGDRNKNTSRLTVEHTNGTGAFAGIRYQKTDWAVEAQISSNVFRNPFGGFNGNDIFTSFGGFVYF
jgi:hypothetical protein